MVVHENHTPLKGCEPQTGVSVRLIFSDYDGVGDWEKTDLRKEEKRKKRWGVIRWGKRTEKEIGEG